MDQRQRCIIAVMLAAVALAAPQGTSAQAPAAVDTAAQTPVKLGAAELQKLVAPIALYPDALVAHVLPASTAGLDVVQAARFLRKNNGKAEPKPDAKWNTSVFVLLQFAAGIGSALLLFAATRRLAGSAAERAAAEYLAGTGAALPGALGFSGDLAGLPEPARERLRWHVRFFKQWRPFLLASEAHLLTPIRPIGDRAGWTAIQLQAPGSEANLVFVYDLPNDGDDRRRFPLRGLQPDRLYAVRQAGPDGESETRVPGAVLAQEGLDVVIPYRQHARWQFRLFVVEPAR